ncbi:formylglycine-generating enzyme family protein [Steroidobacter flavus]|uniref:Formylglycine-generating enzyme family protein n=1 Tax=Steroidobacter flavus TaxID=1842136 RepID=A0ABV8SYC0_9GAMM
MRHSWLAILIVALSSIAYADASEVIRDCADCPEMKVVPAGSFDMGAVDGDAEAKDDERPRHRVTIAKPFAVGIHEVTRAQFEKFIASTGHDAGNSCHGYEDGKWQGKWEDKEGWSWRRPGYAQEPNHPAVCINWYDAKRYVEWLSKSTGKHYRLLTEAEWEYIAQAGKVSVSHDSANYGAEAHCCTSLAAGKDRWLTTAPVASFAPDALGLYDVRGNVWEWLEDCYNDSYTGASTDGSARTANCSLADRRSVRGGGWGDPGRLLRTTYRLRSPVEGRYFGLGFRVARDLD